MIIYLFPILGYSKAHRIDKSSISLSQRYGATVNQRVYFQYRSATLFPSLLWSVAEKGRGEEKRKPSMQNKKGTFSLEDSHESSNFVLKYEIQSPDRNARLQ